MTARRPRDPSADDAELIRWRKQDEAFISQTVKDALKVPLIRDGKGGMQDILPADACPAVLASVIDVRGVDRVYTKRQLMVNALRRLGHYNSRDRAAFRRALTVEVRRYLAAPEEPYHIVFPVNIDRASLGRRRWFNVLGLRFRMRRWARLARHYDTGAFFVEARKRLPTSLLSFLDQSTPLFASVAGRTRVEAFEKAEERFDLLRAVFNMFYTFARYHMQFGPPRSLGKIRQPPIYGLFSEDGDYVTSFLTISPPSEYAIQKPTADHLAYVRKHLDRLRRRSQKGEVQELVIESIRRYGQALDTTDWRSAFLSLWQVLEVMTYKGKADFSMRNVLERTESLLGDNALLKRVLRLSYESRNALVHRGDFPDEQVTDVALLKPVVETCIMSLGSLASDFPTWRDLERYYAHARAHPNDLDQTVKTIRKIQRRKSKKTK